MPNFTKESLEAALEYAIVKKKISGPEVVDAVKSRISKRQFLLKNKKGKILYKVPMEIVEEIKNKLNEDQFNSNLSVKKPIKNNKNSEVLYQEKRLREQEIRMIELEIFKNNTEKMQKRKNSSDAIKTIISIILTPFLALSSLFWLIILIFVIVVICMIF